MNNSKNKDIRFIAVIIILIVLGAANGVADARFFGKNFLDLKRDFEVTLYEDVTVLDTIKYIHSLPSSSDESDPDDFMVFLPAGATGYGRITVWYYNNSEIDASDFSFSATFKSADGESVEVHFSNNPDSIRYDDVVDMNKIVSPESVIDEYRDAGETYRKMWLNHQITGAVIGLIISGIIAAVFILIHKKAKGTRPRSIIFRILIAVDAILLLNMINLLYLFTRLL